MDGILELVRTIFRLDLGEAWQPWLEMRGIIRKLGEKPAAEIEGPPIVIDMKDKKQRMMLNIKAFNVDQEGVGSNEESIGVVADKVLKASEASKITKVSGVYYETVFIEPYALPFHEILIMLKGKFLKQGELIEPATDVALVFDEIQDDVIRHFQIGPMGKKQLLSTYLNWPRENVPDNFVFLSLRYEIKRELEFNEGWLREFLGEAMRWQSEKADLVFNYLKS